MELKIENLSKNFGDKKVLKGINTNLKNGVYGLLGPNGSGKTTLIRILADILNETSGQVLFNGKDKRSCGDDYRAVLGYLPQDMSFYPSFTGVDYLKYIAALKGLSEVGLDAKIRSLATDVGLQDHMHRRCITYSGGMKRRIGIAQALLNDPQILILDEPTSGLDPHERIKFRNIISAFSKDRLVLLSTHIVSDVESIAKEIMMMEFGVVNKKHTASEYIKNTDGCVWMMPISIDKLVAFQKTAIISNVVPKGDVMELRIISESKPSDDAVNVTPTLEDAYMYVFEYLKGSATL